MGFTEDGVSIRVKDSATGKFKVYSFSNETINEESHKWGTEEDQKLARRVSDYVRSQDLGDIFVMPVLLLVRQGVLSFNQNGDLPYFYLSLDENNHW